jgi:hypothetical protein
LPATIKDSIKIQGPGKFLFENRDEQQLVVSKTEKTILSPLMILKAKAAGFDT